MSLAGQNYVVETSGQNSFSVAGPRSFVRQISEDTAPTFGRRSSVHPTITYSYPVSAKLRGFFDAVRPLERLHRVAAVAAFYLANKTIKRLDLGILPSSLTGMISLFVFLLILERGSSLAATTMFRILEPGYRFLLKWAPLFFLPALVKLPCMQERFSGSVLLCLVLLLCGGFLIQLLVTASVASMVFAGDKVQTTDPELAASMHEVGPENRQGAQGAAGVCSFSSVDTDNAQFQQQLYPRPGVPFERRWLLLYLPIMVVTMVFYQIEYLPRLAEDSFMVSASLFFIVSGNALPLRVRRVAHPIILTLMGSWLAAWLWAVQTGSEGFLDVLEHYSTGAGAYLSMLLEPLVVALALLLYERRDVLWQDLLPILTTTFVAAVSGLFSTASFAWLLGLPRMLSIAAVSRFLTAPLALEVAESLSASVPVALAMVTCTGLLGAIFGEIVLTACGINSPPTQGLALGASAHVFGTVSLMSWAPNAVPYAAVCFVMVGSMTVVLASLPPVNAALFYLVD